MGTAAEPTEVEKAAKATPDPRTSVVVAGVSGGKDSAALSLWLTEQGIEHLRVFADTGWENDLTYEHVAYLETVLGPIDRVQSKIGGMRELLRKKGMFPAQNKRFCTEELKFKPIAAYLAEHDCDINAIGIRAAESRKRALMPEWEWEKDIDCHVWRPLITWSDADVVAIHKRHGVRPNPLYLMGASRVGCWPCIYARKDEIKLIAEISPERIDELESLEAELYEVAKARYLARGQDIGKWSPTYFQTKKGPIAIREAVEWSRTAWGGKQYTLIDDPPDGCMRWGMCEHPTGEP